MTTPLFSTYRQGENRVTSTFLSVLQRLSLPNMDRILRELLDSSDFNLVTFRNQPPGDGSTPDALILPGRLIWIETKTARNVVSRKQIMSHLNVVGADDELLVLTPDYDKPEVLKAEEFNHRVVWSNFRVLSDAIRDILADEDDPPTEREDFLLREFILLLEHEGLTTSPEDRVMVVPASSGWPMYKRIGGYRRNPDIRWKASAHLAFYSGGEIKPIVPRIRMMIPSINITRRAEIDSLKDKCQRKLADDWLKTLEGLGHQATQEYDGSYMVFLLSEPDDPETVKIGRSIENDLKAKTTERTVAFVQGRARYVTLESLKSAHKTSDLEFC